LSRVALVSRLAKRLTHCLNFPILISAQSLVAAALLPRTAASATRRAKGKLVDLATSAERRRITLVDDEPHSLDVLTRATRSWDFECQTATTAEEALALFERRPTPVVVTDLRMPGRGGSWLVRELQRRWPETSIIVVTAWQDEAALAECLQAGAHYFFLKPIQLDEFRNALRVTFTSHKVRRERERYRERLQKQTRTLRRTFLSAIDSLVRTLEARDPYTSGHSFRVRDYAGRLAEALGLPDKLKRKLRLAAKLHDIGKVGMPEGILNKTTPLTNEEIGEMRDHPVIGERILSPIIRSRDVLGAIRNHHERWDGSGYPDGLTGERIPYLARIIAVADCFDALTSVRAYRTSLQSEAALAVLELESGSHFDPALVPVFAKIVTQASRLP
jgi:putative two-component system response regulator